jgi:signal transduction histidine kinase
MKPTGTGTGLGLSLSYDMVTEGHGGRLRVGGPTVHDTERNAPGKPALGAAFIIELPAKLIANSPIGTCEGRTSATPYIQFLNLY